MIIKRKSRSDHSVEWQPDDEQLAEQAVQTIAEDEGVESISELEQHSDEYGGFEYLPREHCDALRNEYERLHVEKYGQDSPFYDSEDQ